MTTWKVNDWWKTPDSGKVPEMVLGTKNSTILVTEIQSKRQERKRRTTANPVYSGAVFEPEVLDFRTIKRGNLKEPRHGSTLVP